MAWVPVHVEFEMTESPQEARRWWQANYTDWMAAGKYLPTGTTADVLTYTRRYIPGPAILFAVLIFPVGLLLLLLKREAILTVAFEPTKSGTVVTITGTAQPAAASSFRALAASAPSSDPARSRRDDPLPPPV
jgi:hypothetical protein